MLINELKFEEFAECEGCINREFDPDRCRTCKQGSNFEGTDIEQELSYHDFLDFVRGEDL